MNQILRLYEFAPTRSIRVRWTLQELDLPFEAISVNLVAGEHRRPEFLRLNPAGKVPVLIDGALTLSESVAICVHLAQKHAERDFLPSDETQRAQVHQWLLFAATELEQPLWRIARHTALYPESRRLATDVVLAGDDFRAISGVLEEHLAGRRFVVADRVTIADFVLAYTLDWANEAALLENRPRMQAYLEQMYARPRAPMRIAAALRSIGAR